MTIRPPARPAQEQSNRSARPEGPLRHGLRLTSARSAFAAAFASLVAWYPLAARAVETGQFRGGDGLVGVWMGIPPGLGSDAPRARWKMFFDDGQAFADLPDTRWSAFDRAARRGHSGAKRIRHSLSPSSRA